MGFTLGGLDELDDAAVRCLIAVDADRTVHGITSWLPVYRDGVPVGWTLDFMRRRWTGVPGGHGVPDRLGRARPAGGGRGVLSLSGAPLARLRPRAAGRPSAADAARRARPGPGAGLRVPLAAGVQGQVPARATSRCSWPTPTRPRCPRSAPPSAAPTCRTWTPSSVRLLARCGRAGADRSRRSRGGPGQPGGMSRAGLPSKKPLGLSMKPMVLTGITGQSSGRTMWCAPNVYQHQQPGWRRCHPHVSVVWPRTRMAAWRSRNADYPHGR